MNSFIAKNKTIIGIILLSILLQLIFVFHNKANPIESDAIQYDMLAKNLLHNHIFSLDGKTINLTRSPGYPFFLYFIYLVFGEKAQAVQILQIILIALIPLIIYKISLILFDKKIGFLAALLTALSPILICQSFFLLSESLMTFLMAITMYLAVISMRDCKISHFILLGICLGAAALTRPIVLLLPFFAILILIFFYHWKIVLRFSLFFLVPFFLFVGIWVYKDYKATGYFIPLQIMGGRSLWTGTYIPGEGFDEHPLTIQARDKLSQRLSDELKDKYGKLIGEKSGQFDILTLLAVRQMGHEGVKNITSNPVGLIKILPFKLGRLYIGSYSYLYGVKDKFEELFSNKGDLTNKELKLGLKFSFLFISIFIFIFSLIGVLSSLRKSRYLLPIIILFLYWNFMFIFLDSMTRYSIPIIPIMILMAAKGLYFTKNIFIKE